jgi:hypothetical protein
MTVQAAGLCATERSEIFPSPQHMDRPWDKM